MTNPNSLEQQLRGSIERAKAQRASQANAVPLAEQLQQPNGSSFRRAVKFDAKGRVALIGVSGSGKSFTMLKLARALAGPTGKIACIDTEHGSLSKYADLCAFDVDEPSSYTEEYLLSQLDYAEDNGYAVFCVDSLSHFWMGADGTLEFVDKVKRRSQEGNGFAGWNAWNPKERKIIDRFIGSPCHIIVTMRVKTEYQEMVDERGRKKRVKIGLQPIQRDGLEYEFDLVCSMDDENNLLVDKTRCSAYSADKLRVASKPDAKYFQPFIDWLAGAARPAAPPPPPPAPTPINGNAAPAAPAAIPSWTTSRAKIREEFAKLQESVPEDAYYEVLSRHGVDSDLRFRTAGAAWTCYQKLWAVAEKATDPTTYENFAVTEEGVWA